jgi:hypothetical protein
MNNTEISRMAMICGGIFVAMTLVSNDLISRFTFSLSMLFCWGLAICFGLAKEGDD